MCKICKNGVKTCECGKDACQKCGGCKKCGTCHC